ncbi:MAG: helix-turn-helix domain-containing protein [Planctomycetota bacterium]|nr:helix-turn-helix domain-containing protein [Planctomycetota bacterium]
MDWKTFRFAMPLAEPPRIKALAFGRHPSGEYTYRLPGYWCLHLFRVEAELRIDGRTFPIRPGHASITPPGAKLDYAFPTFSDQIYSHYALPAADGLPTTAVPAMQDLGGEFAQFESLMGEAVGYFPSQPRRAEARLWEILWRLSDRAADAGEPEGEAHPALREARRQIEVRLGDGVEVAWLARRVGLSHNQLTRLFRAGTGQTVVGYIRQRRLERARHLLTNSTLPIKAVAAEVGLPDLHQFNKFIREALGQGPRAVREGRS